MDAGEFGLEIESVTHLVEKESEEEVAPVVVKLSETFNFNLGSVLVELVTVGEGRGNWTANHARNIQVRLPIVVVRAIFHPETVLCYIILEVDSVVCCVNKVLDTLF